MNLYRRLTGLRVFGGGPINDAIEKVLKFPWWRSKTVIFRNGHYYSVGDLTIPNTVSLYFLSGASCGAGQIFSPIDGANPEWWGAKKEK